MTGKGRAGGRRLMTSRDDSSITRDMRSLPSSWRSPPLPGASPVQKCHPKGHFVISSLLSHICSSPQEEQSPDALVTPNGSHCYQLSQEGSACHRAAGEGCSGTQPRLGLDRAAREVWEMKISALGQQLVFLPIPYGNAGCDCALVHSPPPRDIGTSWPPPTPNRAVPAELRRTRRVFRQEKLCSSIVPPHEGRGRSLPTTTASDIRESTPKHQGAAPAPQILLLGKRPDKPSPIPGEEDVSPCLPAPKPRPRSHREVASQGWKIPGSGTAGSKPCNSPGPPFPDPPALGHSFSSLLRSRCPVAALWLLVEPTCASSPATGILRGCRALSTPWSPFCQHEVSWMPG